MAKFRFTDDEAVAAYGDGWFELVGDNNLPASTVRACRPALGMSIDEVFEKAAENKLFALLFLVWASVVKAGHPVKWDDFECDLMGVEYDAPDEEPAPQIPDDASATGVPGVNPTRRKAPRKKAASKRK